MRRIIFIIAIISLILVLNLNKKQDIQSVFLDGSDKEENKTDYRFFYLDFRKTELTTKNFKKYFSGDIEIIRLYPYINPIYKKKINSELYSYDFNYSNLERNLNTLDSNYLDMLKKLSTNLEYENTYLYGVKIDIVKVYSNYELISKIIDKNKNIKIHYSISEIIY